MFKKCVIIFTVLLVGCVQNNFIIDSSKLISVTDSVDMMIHLVERHERDFSREDWERLQRDKIELNEAIYIIRKSGTISIDQIKMIRDTVKDAYMEARTIIINNLDSFTLQEKLTLLELDKKVIDVDNMITDLEDNPSSDKYKKTLDAIIIVAKATTAILAAL